VEELGVEYDSPEFYEVFELSLKYILKSITFTKYHALLGNTVNFKKLDSSITPAGFRLKLRSNGYMLTSVKFYTMYLLASKVTREFAEDTYPAYKLFRCDARVVFNMLNKRGMKAELKRTSGFKWSKSEVTPKALATAQNQFREFLPEVQKFCTTARHKTYFICKSNNFSYSEFESELLMEALRAFYFMIPTQITPEAVLNYLRKSMSNANKNIIEKYTSDKNGRLVNEGTDASGASHFNLKVVSQSQLSVVADEDGEVQYDNIFSEDHSRMQNAHEFEFSVKQLIQRKYKSGLNDSHRQAELLSMFMGYPNKPFESFLRKKRIIRSSRCATEFLGDRSKSEYMPVLSQYFGVSERCLTLYLTKIAQDLGYVE
tara:strand:+ start:4210 stop:5328 length:1119 start_codon:yes stop_codon:yes gene_type:complete